MPAGQIGIFYISGRVANRNGIPTTNHVFLRSLGSHQWRRPPRINYGQKWASCDPKNNRKGNAVIDRNRMLSALHVFEDAHAFKVCSSVCNVARNSKFGHYRNLSTGGTTLLSVTQADLVLVWRRLAWISFVSLNKSVCWFYYFHLFNAISINNVDRQLYGQFCRHDIQLQALFDMVP